jgi:glucose-6-phosphate isomerase, archaeal
MQIEWLTGALLGPEVRRSQKTLGDLAGIFADRVAWEKMPAPQVVYRVEWWSPSAENTEGGLSWGTTTIEPGLVGSEYFMTHGHIHAKADRTEFYGGIQGEGALILMDESRRTWTEPMFPGSLHHIPPRTAHRVANTSNVPLRFTACWPSDAGHNYEIVRQQGFSSRLFRKDGKPVLVAAAQ